MKNKSDLKRKVLCSLLAASTMGIFYSSDALAASVNGKPVDTNGDGIITETELVGAGSHHFIIAEGEDVALATNNDANALISSLQTAIQTPGTMEKLLAVKQALAENSTVGFIGGTAKLDKSTLELLTMVKELSSDGDIVISGLNVTDLANKLANINRVDESQPKYEYSKDTGIIIGTNENHPVVIGGVGGDFSINTGFNLNDSLNPDEKLKL